MLVQRTDFNWVNLPTDKHYRIGYDNHNDSLMLFVAEGAHVYNHKLIDISSAGTDWGQLTADNKTRGISFMQFWFTTAVQENVIRLPFACVQEASTLILRYIESPNNDLFDQLRMHVVFSCKRWIVAESGLLCIDQTPDFSYTNGLSIRKDGITHRIATGDMDVIPRLVFFITKQPRGVISRDDLTRAREAPTNSTPADMPGRRITLPETNTP